MRPLWFQAGTIKLSVCTPPPENHLGTKALWALFEFLEGEDKYSWTDTHLTDKEFISAAETLAHLHHCGHGFKKPPGADRAQPRIMDLMPGFKKTFCAVLENTGEGQCDRLFNDNFRPIREALDHAESISARFQGMPEIPIHCDYHPGNLKFCDQKIVGVFDFDWSKIDYRLFDVALGLVYFTSFWDDRATGLSQDKFSLFLSAYNEACRRFAHISLLTEQEQKSLVPMISSANLYILNWELTGYFLTPEPDDDCYYRFIEHTVGLIQWIASNEDELDRWVNNSTIQRGPV